MSFTNINVANVQKSLHSIPYEQHQEWLGYAEGVLTLASFAKVQGIRLDTPRALEDLAVAMCRSSDLI